MVAVPAENGTLSPFPSASGRWQGVLCFHKGARCPCSRVSQRALSWKASRRIWNSAPAFSKHRSFHGLQNHKVERSYMKDPESEQVCSTRDQGPGRQVACETLSPLCAVEGRGMIIMISGLWTRKLKLSNFPKVTQKVLGRHRLHAWSSESKSRALFYDILVASIYKSVHVDN